MKRVTVLVVLIVGGCQVASRNMTEFDFLTQVEALIDKRDRCGLFRLVTSRPEALSGNSPLAIEFRNFVEFSRAPCTSGKPIPEDGGLDLYPDMRLVHAARREQPTTRAPGLVAAPSVPSSPADKAADRDAPPPTHAPAPDLNAPKQLVEEVVPSILSKGQDNVQHLSDRLGAGSLLNELNGFGKDGL